MNLSESDLRGVITPLDNAAERAIKLGEVGETIRIHHIKISDPAECAVLFKNGIFEAITESTGILVSTYEEAEIPAELIPHVRKLAHIYMKKRTAGVTGAWFFPALLEACDLAERSGRAIHFVL